MSSHVGDCFKFCGLLRKPELYRKIQKFLNCSLYLRAKMTVFNTVND